MRKPFLECGKIVSTHGVLGEMRVQPWCDSPEDLEGIKTLYFDGGAAPAEVLRARAHKNVVLLKLRGVDTVEQAQALRGRLHILGKMNEVLPAPRKELSKYAPKITQFTINPDKIREVIGPGGKMINKIIDETGVKIDIDDDGSVYIATPDEAAAAKARRIIEGIAKDIEVGEVYTGKVVRMMNFGVFVELLPGKDGMVHISKLAKGRVEKCEDVVKIGDELEVKVAEIDSQGRINLVRNDIEYDNAEMPRRSAPGQRPPRRDANRR